MANPSDILVLGAGPAAPPPPSFKCPDVPTVPQVMVENEQGGLIELPFVRYALLDNAPIILGTEGCEEVVYGCELKALPMPPLSWTTMHDNRELDLLITDYPFNFTLDMALFHMGDPGVLRDVYHFHQAYLRLMSLKCEGESLQNTLATLQKEQALHLEWVQAHIKEVEEVKVRLITARVCTHIEPIMAQLAINGIIPNAVFTQYFGPTGAGHPNKPLRRACPIVDPASPPVIL